MLGELGKANARVDEVLAYHDMQRRKFDELKKQNEEAIVMHNKIEKIFKTESEAFFLERLKWKTDAEKKINLQDVKLNECLSLSERLNRKVTDSTTSMTSLVDCILL